MACVRGCFRVWVMSLVLSPFGGLAWADTVVRDGARSPVCEGVLPAPQLPADLRVALRADPVGFVDEISVIILGFGGARGIDEAGLTRMILVDRAALRASALRQLGVADLDGDDLIREDEVREMAFVASARARGRVLRLFQKADADKDGQVTRDELRAHADAEADRLIARRAGMLMGLMALDRDGDGFVTTGELNAAVAAAVAEDQVAWPRGEAKPVPSPI